MPGRYNEILVGRFNRGLQKLFQIKGPPPVPTLASEIIAVHCLKNGYENLYLEGWTRFGAIFTVTASAGNISAFRLVNPLSNNVLIVLEKLAFFPQNAAGACAVSVGFINANLANIISLTNTALGDTRGNPSPSAIGSFSQLAAVANLNTTIFQFQGSALLPQDAIITDIQEICLSPGNAVQFTNTVANQALNPVIWWRERPIEDSEKF